MNHDLLRRGRAFFVKKTFYKNQRKLKKQKKMIANQKQKETKNNETPTKDSNVCNDNNENQHTKKTMRRYERAKPKIYKHRIRNSAISAKNNSNQNWLNTHLWHSKRFKMSNLWNLEIVLLFLFVCLFILFFWSFCGF